MPLTTAESTSEVMESGRLKKLLNQRGGIGHLPTCSIQEVFAYRWSQEGGLVVVHWIHGILLLPGNVNKKFGSH